MADTLLITKADFTGANLVKFSQNIAEDQLNLHIHAAQEYDLEPRLGEELYDAVLGAETAFPLRPELLVFINKKVKRYLVLAAYRRFISAHGLNVTQFGLTKTADPQGTFNQAEAQERAIITRQIDADANVALLKMTSAPFTFDGLSYEKANKAGNVSASIRAPKRRNKVFVYGTSIYSDLINR
jgi:hypothetical protein